MTTTATRATQHDDSAPLQHVHVWGEIKHDDPPAYLVAAHGPSALAAIDRRYRACTGRGCEARVCGTDVTDPDVLAHLSAAARCPLDDTTVSPRLTTAGATA